MLGLWLHRCSGAAAHCSIKGDYRDRAICHLCQNKREPFYVSACMLVCVCAYVFMKERRREGKNPLCLFTFNLKGSRGVGSGPTAGQSAAFKSRPGALKVNMPVKCDTLNPVPGSVGTMHTPVYLCLSAAYKLSALIVNSPSLVAQAKHRTCFCCGFIGTRCQPCPPFTSLICFGSCSWPPPGNVFCSIVCYLLAEPPSA